MIRKRNERTNDFELFVEKIVEKIVEKNEIFVFNQRNKLFFFEFVHLIRKHRCHSFEK